jgi:hypothetical protein
VAGAGITSLNGLTAGGQTFSIGTSGNSPAFSSATSTHTLNIPMASTASVTAGLISKTDYDAFNAKLSAVNNTASLAATTVWIGNASGVAQEFALSGDVTMTSGGVVTVDKTQSAVASKILQLTASSVAVTKGTDIGGAGAGVAHLLYPNTATNTTLTLPSSAGSANQFLQTDGAGSLTWATPAATLPGLASTQVWVGNASGAAAAVALSGDIASVSNAGVVTVNKTTTAQASKLLSLDGSGVGAMMGTQLNGLTSGSLTLQPAAVTTNYSLTFPGAQGGSGQTLSNNGSGVLSWITPLTSSTAFVNGGNTFAGNSSLGNNDNFNLDIKTNNISRMTILNSGNVGIGTTLPGSPLTVNGTIESKTGGIKFPDGTVQTSAATPTSSFTLISNTGTTIGTATQQGGLAAAFDGNTNQNETSCAYLANGNGSVGKDFGAGQAPVISRWVAWGSGDSCFNNPLNGAVQVQLQFSDDNSTWITADSFTTAGNCAVPGDPHDRTLYSSTGHRYWRVYVPGPGDTRIAEVAFYTGGGSVGTTLWAANGTSIFYNTGNVGIGTTNPATTLDVNGSVRPGSTGVTTGGACTAEGSFAYDITAHSPVYCNDSGIWTAMSANKNGGVVARINFDGTSCTPSCTIRSSSNISSVVRNGVGDYTLNFTTAIVDADYSVAATAGFMSLGSYGRFVDIYGTPTTTSLRILVNASSSTTDVPIVTVTVFR